MKSLFRSIDMAFAMFSIIPMPNVEWKKEIMRWMLCALPLVGVVIGAVLCLWYWLCRLLGFGPVLFAAGLTLLPILISGGVHMDGFCDTVDALASHAEPARKREILKDSHTGAFAVIAVGSYLVLYAALGTELYGPWAIVLIVGISQVLARVVGALCSVMFPSSPQHGLLFAFSDAASKKAAAVLGVWGAACAAALIWLSVPAGIVTVALAACCIPYLHHMAMKQFGGMSGDLAGYVISLSSIVMLFGLVVVVRVMLP